MLASVQVRLFFRRSYMHIGVLSIRTVLHFFRLPEDCRNISLDETPRTTALCGPCSSLLRLLRLSVVGFRSIYEIPQISSGNSNCSRWKGPQQEKWAARHPDLSDVHL